MLQLQNSEYNSLKTLEAYLTKSYIMDENDPLSV